MFRSKVMFIILFTALTGLQATASGPSQSAKGIRVIHSLDQDWTFQYFSRQTPDKRWAEPAAEDAKWPAIALPHTWSVYETTRDVHPFIEHATERKDSYWWYGWGWYRKHFSISKRFDQKLVFLEF